MHAHNSHPPGAEAAGPTGILDSLSDTLLNAFTKVRKPDERFLEMREGIDKFEEGMSGTERVILRNRTRTSGESSFPCSSPILRSLSLASLLVESHSQNAILRNG